MIHPIKIRMRLEIDKFKSLPPKARNLLLSYIFQGASNPILGTFMNAYIWRIEGDFLGVALFNLGNFIGLPLTFFINGILLRFVAIDVLYTLGSVTLGLGVLAVVLLARLGINSYLLFGLIFGVGYGLYWSNRNYLTLKLTKSANRNYFVGLNFTLDTATSILMPFLVGWFIFFGGKAGIETYVVNAVCAFLLLLVSGILVVRGKHESPTVGNLIARNVSPRWQTARILTFGIGVLDGLAFFLVSLLVLASIGHEGILGTVDSATSVLLGVLFYFYGRKAKVRHQKTTYITSVLVGIIGCLFLLFGVTSVAGALVFTSFYYFSIAFIWLATDPMVMDIMDTEIKTKHQNRYSLVFDRELFLNLGRWLSIAIFVSSLTLFGSKTTVLVTPAVTYLVHFFLMLVVLNKLGKYKNTGLDKTNDR